MSHAYAIEVAKDNPAIYWRLHEDSGAVAEDISGNSNDGTIDDAPTFGVTGPLAMISGLGEVTKAMTFDGSNDGVWNNDGAVTSLPATIECWFKTPASVSSNTTYMELSLTDPLTNGDGGLLQVRTDGSDLKLRTGLYGQGFSFGTTILSLDTWYHLVVVLESGTQTMYVNGVSDGTNSASDTWSGVTHFGVAKTNRNSDAFWAGTVSEVALYDTALSASRIRAHYSVGLADQWLTRAILRHDPQVYWRLNEADLSTAADQSVNGLDGTEVGAPTEQQGTAIVDDNAANSASFDGSDDGVRNDSITAPAAFGFTLLGFAKSPATTSSDTFYGIIGIFNTSDPESDRVFVTLRTDGGNVLKAWAWREGSNIITGGTTLTKDQWYMIAVVQTAADDFELFVNGVSDGSDATSVGLPANANYFSVGYMSDSTPIFGGGSIGDAAYIDHTLTAAELYAIYKIGITSSRYARSIHYDKPALFWRLNEASGATAADDALGGNDGTHANSPVLNGDTPLVGDDSGASVNYDGVDQWTRVGVAVLSSYPFSMEKFSRAPSAATATYSVLSLGDESADGTVLLGLRGSGGSNLLLRFQVYSGGAGQNADTAEEIAPNTWAHTVGVARASNDFEAFIDGVSKATNTTGKALPAVDNVVSGGLDRTNNFFYSGDNAEIALYDYSLSLPQIRAHSTIAVTSLGQTFQASVSDGIALTDTPRVVFAISLADAINIGVQVGTAWLFELSESLTLGDATGVLYRALGDVNEGLQLSDSANVKLTALAQVSDGLVVDEQVGVLGRFIASAADELNMLVTIGLKDETWLGIALNTQNLAYSNYTGWDFNSMAALDDLNLGAGEDGIYSLEGDTDDGANIAASIKTGIEHFGDMDLKRIPEVFLGCRNDGSLVLKVTHVDSQGNKQERWYQLTKTSGAIQNKRIKLAKGVESEVWEMELVNRDGADFELDNITFVPVRLTRRIR